MHFPSFVTLASALLASASSSLAAEVQPAAVYDGGYADKGEVELKIGNGGAGQSGLVKAISNAFIQHKRGKSGKDFHPFSIGWYKSDTTYSIKYLQTGTVDVAITYSEIAEKLAIQQGIAVEPSYYIFRDHFYLVGPPSNPAKINSNMDILDQFSKLYEAAELGDTTPPVRFLARYDKSATSIKDSELWLKIGQVPWAYAYSTWYHVYPAFPLQALNASRLLEEYTITDRGTYYSYPAKPRKELKIFKEGSDNATDPLLNPAHLLIGKKAASYAFAKEFTDFLTSEKGQAVIGNYTNEDGVILYTRAPAKKEQKAFNLWQADTEPYHFAKPQDTPEMLVQGELK